jgi:hypothetical protein
MEALPGGMLHEQGLVACCECGTAIVPNNANMCVGCLRSRVDITEGISRQCKLIGEGPVFRFFVGIALLLSERVLIFYRLLIFTLEELI